jgi:hypothetical protein
MAPSSSGLGLWLLKPATRVRIPSGLLFVLQRARKELGNWKMANNLS